jgi:hypothetical protein
MIKNIAVCLYGRFGTGEYCAPSILKFFKNTLGVNVDFFCATKDYDNYYTTNYKTIHAGGTDIERLDISDLTNKLSVYNPKDIAISTLEEDERRRGAHPSSNGHMFSQMSNSIMLKSKYEVNNDMQYDVVFVTRYDILIKHGIDTTTDNFYLDHYIAWHNNEFINKQYDLFSNTSKAWMFSHQMGKNPGHLSEVFRNIYQDMLFFGSSLAMDLFAANALLITSDQHHKTNKKTHIYPDLYRRDGHEGLGYIFRKSNISVSICPSFDLNGIMMYTIDNRIQNNIWYVPVRAFGEMNFAATSIEAFNRNCWIWSNSVPYTECPDYIEELQTLIATCEQDIALCNTSTAIAKKAHIEAKAALASALANINKD